MSDPKIKSKDLSYSAPLPPFLQRLHAQKAGRTGDEDRHERALARPKRMKTAEKLEEDLPTVVDERGEIVGREAAAQLNRDEEPERKGKAEPFEEGEGGDVNERSREDGDRADGRRREVDAAVTMGKKRKVGKVIGDDVEGEGKEVEKAGTEKKIKKTKKKVKPIKLAFEDEGDGEET